jgi:peptide/nickel transport system substrate-binding protein
VLRFATPLAEFPRVLCELPILPRHLLNAVPRASMRQASFNLAPVGNGPFRFVRRDPGARWVFERNESFPALLGGPPRARGVVVAVVDEATTKFAGLASGELDVAGISPTMAGLASRDPSMRLVTYPVLFSTALVFNAQRPPFEDVRVRRALSLALDRTRIVQAALAGYATPAAGPVPPESPLALPAAPTRDARLADSLLDAAGWHRGSDRQRARSGRALEVELLTVGSGDNAVEQLVQADFADRGVRLEIRQVEMGAFLTRARAPRKEFDLLLTGIPGDASLSFLAAMYESRQKGGALDYGGFHLPELDAAFARVRGAADTAAVRVGWLAVQQELARTMPAAWLYHSRGVQGVSARLRGVEMDLRGELPTVARWERVP